MKHWDLTPKQLVTLIRQDGHKVEARFLFRDTVRASFAVGDDKWVVPSSLAPTTTFQLQDDGSLRTAPTTEQLYLAAMKIHGTTRHAIRTLIEFGSLRSRKLALKRTPRWTIAPA